MLVLLLGSLEESEEARQLIAGAAGVAPSKTRR
jgi:hypothetical protein